MELRAFHNKQSIKDFYVERVQRHFDADEIIKGVYWEKGRGCGVGCTIESSENPHQKFEDELGISRTIAKLEDRLFEGLTNGDAKKFPVRFLEAVNVGADLSMVVPKFMVWMLSDKKDGVLKSASKDGKKIIKKIVKLYKKQISGGIVTQSEWIAVSGEAWVVRRAAYADAYASVAADAAAYASAAAYAAADAYAYAYAYADAYARNLHYKKMADKLIEILEECK